jgi:hypothetical protein
MTVSRAHLSEYLSVLHSLRIATAAAGAISKIVVIFAGLWIAAKALRVSDEHESLTSKALGFALPDAIGWIPDTIAVLAYAIIANPPVLYSLTALVVARIISNGIRSCAVDLVGVAAILSDFADSLQGIRLTTDRSSQNEAGGDLHRTSLKERQPIDWE